MTQRTERVAGLLLKEISQIIREDVQNPRIGFVTLLRVEVTADLRLAKIFYSVLGSDDEKKITDIELKNSAKFIKKLVNDRLQMRYAIDLRFVRESSIDESFRLESIFDKIRKQRGDKPEKPEEGPQEG